MKTLMKHTNKRTIACCDTVFFFFVGDVFHCNCFVFVVGVFGGGFRGVVGFVLGLFLLFFQCSLMGGGGVGIVLMLTLVFLNISHRHEMRIQFLQFKDISLWLRITEKHRSKQCSRPIFFKSQYIFTDSKTQTCITLQLKHLNFFLETLIIIFLILGEGGRGRGWSDI